MAPEHSHTAHSEAAPPKQSLVPCPCHHWIQAEPGWQKSLEVLREGRGEAEERQEPSGAPLNLLLVPCKICKKLPSRVPEHGCEEDVAHGCGWALQTQVSCNLSSGVPEAGCWRGEAKFPLSRCPRHPSQGLP